jgi:hypothetical protein
MNLILKRIGGIISLLLLLAMGACTKNDGGGGGGGGNTSTGANITGSVVVYDDKGNQNADDKANVKVEVLSGTTVVASTLSRSTGEYTLGAVKFGTYTLQFSRSDIGMYKVFNVNHQYQAGSTTQVTVISTVQLGLESTTSVTGLTYTGNTYNGGSGASFTLTVSPDPSTNSRAYFRIFVSNDAGVSKDNYGVATELRSLISNNATIGFTSADLASFGLTSGQTAYIRVYGDSFQANSYTDPVSGKKVYPNINSNTVAAVSFVVP